MEKVLLFEINDACYQSYHYFTQSIAAELEKSGYDVEIFHGTKDKLDELEKYIGKSYKACIDFNSFLPKLIRDDDSFLIDAIDAPYYDFILDHPLYHHDSLRRNLRDFHVFCLDENHKKYIEKYYPHIKRVHMIPITGEEFLQPEAITARAEKNEAVRIGDEIRAGYNEAVQDESVTWSDKTVSGITVADKNIDVLFTGTYVNPGEILDLINEEPEFMKEDILFLIDQMLTHNEMTQEDALQIRMKESDYIEEENFSLFMQRYFLADTYVKAFIREKIIKSLVEAQIPVTVCGYGWDKLFGTEQKALTILKEIPYHNIFKLMSEAKILLNIMPLFKAGAHDRVFSGMMNKCLCLTDSSSYLEKNFENFKNIVFFDLNHLEDISNIITKLLENPTQMKAISEAGYTITKEKHTWKNRVEEILEAIQ